MKIDIKHVAKLAKLRIEDDRVEKFEQEMLSILTMVEHLPEITGEESGLDPANPMKLREDIVQPSMKRDLVLANAPDVKSGCIVVPKTLE